MENVVDHFNDSGFILKEMRRLGTGLQSRFESSNATTINMKSHWDKSSKTKQVALEMERGGENPEIHKKYSKPT